MAKGLLCFSQEYAAKNFERISKELFNLELTKEFHSFHF